MTDRPSVLGDLKARRQQIVDQNVLTLPVPRWTDPELKVKFRPVPHEEVRAAGAKVEKAPARQKAATELAVNSDMLIRNCTAVVAIVDGKEYSLDPDDPTGEPTRFDDRLAANLGLEEGATARQVVRAVYLTDGDILSTARALGEWSGYHEAAADEDLAGE